MIKQHPFLYSSDKLSLLSSLQVQGKAGYRFQNWAQTYSSCPEKYFQPSSVEDVRQILAMARQSSKRVKVVGGGHSPSDIACTDEFMISLDKMNRVLEVNKEERRVTVEAGIFLCDLNEELTKHGLALSNLGAVAEVAAAGVIGTGTHNTGIDHGILPTQVVSLSLMTAVGEVLHCSDSVNQDIFQAARLHLGSLGVILSLTYQCQPAFRLHERQFPSTLTEVSLSGLIGKMAFVLLLSGCLEMLSFPFTKFQFNNIKGKLR
ncbi:GGLO oxidase, partial [Amia calva]|nr:GGLO oxidase [Amia calva]